MDNPIYDMQSFLALELGACLGFLVFYDRLSKLEIAKKEPASWKWTTEA